MSTLLRLLIPLLLLLLPACAAPSATPRTATSTSTPILPSPTATSTPLPTLTPTPAPPSLESLGLSPETQSMLERQGWQITWEYGRIGDSPQPGRYLISQLAFDETTQNSPPNSPTK